MWNILLLVFLYYAIKRYFFPGPKEAEEMEQNIVKQKACPPHKWEYKENQPMQCQECKLIAGQVRTSGGEY